MLPKIYLTSIIFAPGTVKTNTAKTVSIHILWTPEVSLRAGRLPTDSLPACDMGIRQARARMLDIEEIVGVNVVCVNTD